jgi:hypothetical protein
MVKQLTRYKWLETIEQFLAWNHGILSSKYASGWKKIAQMLQSSKLCGTFLCISHRKSLNVHIYVINPP